MQTDALILGIDGGGTRCRARLCEPSGDLLGEGTAGPANIYRGLEEGVAAICDAAGQCLSQAGLSPADLRRTTACLALAGASEPAALAAMQQQRLPFGHTLVTTDAQAACVGAHRGRDGGVIIAGTGTVGWAELGGRSFRVGGWGLSISDEGSGAWLGREALRRVLWAHDGRAARTALLEALFGRFQCDPHAIVAFGTYATPREFGALAPDVAEHAGRNDPAGVELMRLAGGHIDALAARLGALGAQRLALVGGLAASIEPWLSDETRARLVPPAGDAVDGALRLARAATDKLAA
jgi:glucosamine kinase